MIRRNSGTVCPTLGSEGKDMHPKSVMAYAYQPGKRLFHIIFELRNQPGTMAGVGSLLERFDIRMLQGFASSEGGRAVWGIFAEEGGRPVDLQELEGALRSSPFLIDATIRESKDGLLVDSEHFPLTLGAGDRIVIMRTNLLSGMFKRLRTLFGSGGNVVLYEEGLEYGKEAAEMWMGRVGRRFVVEHAERLLQIPSSVGWARVALEGPPDGRTATVRLWDSFECSGQKSDACYSQFVRGYLCGLFRAVTAGTAMECTETSCVAKGDGFCEFRVSPKADAPPKPRGALP